MLIEVDSNSAPLYVTGRDRRLRIMGRMPWWRIAVAAAPAALTAAAAWSLRSPLLAIAAAALLLPPVALAAWLWRRIDTTVNTTTPLSRHWTITKEEIRVSGPDATRTWRWAAVVAVTTSPDAYLMRQEGGITLDLPRSAMTDAQEDELRRFLTDRRLLT